MKYENAKDFLPDDIFRLVQKYAGGKLLYVPIEEESKSWGEVSGIRKKLLKRNQLICNKYKYGKTISELSEEYFLSIDSIKKILYSKKHDLSEFTTEISSAVKYMNQGLLEEWLETYQMAFVESHHINRLNYGDYICFGVVKLPLRLVILGESRHNNEYSDSFEKLEKIEIKSEVEKTAGFKDGAINATIKSLEYGIEKEEVLIVRYDNMRFYIDFQHNYFELLKSHNINTYPSIVIIRNMEAYKVFMKHYGKHFNVINKV